MQTKLAFDRLSNDVTSTMGYVQNEISITIMLLDSEGNQKENQKEARNIIREHLIVVEDYLKYKNEEFHQYFLEVRKGCA